MSQGLCQEEEWVISHGICEVVFENIPISGNGKFISTAKFFILQPFCESPKHLREVWGTVHLLLHVPTHIYTI